MKVVSNNQRRARKREIAIISSDLSLRIQMINKKDDRSILSIALKMKYFLIVSIFPRRIVHLICLLFRRRIPEHSIVNRPSSLVIVAFNITYLSFQDISCWCIVPPHTWRTFISKCKPIFLLHCGWLRLDSSWDCQKYHRYRNVRWYLVDDMGKGKINAYPYSFKHTSFNSTHGAHRRSLARSSLILLLMFIEPAE